MTAPRWSAAAVIDTVVDADTFVAWDEDLRSGDPLAFSDARPYRDRLRDAASAAGVSEGVVTGAALIGGREVVLVVSAFEFLAGTQGIVVGERVTRAFERAAAAGMPVIGLPASGGTRMQEGSLAFVQMLKIAATVAHHRVTGQRFVSWLRDPTTGGVLASWGMLAQAVWAQPRALVALTGPRVVELTEGRSPPGHRLRSEHLAACGAIDGVVAIGDLRDHLRRVVGSFGSVAPDPAVVVRHGAPAPPADPRDGTVDAWEAVERSRVPGRPGIRQLLAVADDVVGLGGVGAGGWDPGVVTAVCRLDGVRTVLIGQDRPPDGRGARLGAVGYRAARRAMRLAAELGLPLVAVIDTSGAATTTAAEEGGLAREIALSMATMSALPVPTVAVLMGEGSGGGAIAWLAADRVIAAAHAWLAPIAPEGASAILFRTTDHAAALARRQAIDVGSLTRLGVVDRTVDDRARWVPDRLEALAGSLRALRAVDDDARQAARRGRLRAVGDVGPAGAAESRSEGPPTDG